MRGETDRQKCRQRLIGQADRGVGGEGKRGGRSRKKKGVRKEVRGRAAVGENGLEGRDREKLKELHVPLCPVAFYMTLRQGKGSRGKLER